MNSADDVLDASKLCFEGDFNAQVQNLMYAVRLTATEVHNLRNLFQDLEFALQPLGPGLQVLPFGSIVTGLGIKTSDVDCYIALPNDTKPDKSYVIYARNILRKHYRKFADLFAITTATVPIVKFTHIPTNCKCDVNFKSPAGVQNSELIGVMLRMDQKEQVLKLAVLVKYWSKVHKITGTNLLASYGLTMMVIFYLQLQNILPSVKDMQQNVPPYIIENWNTSFNNQINAYSNYKESFHQLVGGFFVCYSNLNFDENIISPYMGRLLNRKTFKDLNDIPPGYDLYKENVSSNICKPLRIDTPICIQDPFEHSRNTAGGVHARLAARIKAHFQFAAKKFNELPEDQFLQAILTEDPNKALPPSKKTRRGVNHGVQHGRINKYKQNQQAFIQKKRGLQNNINLLRCYEQISGNRARKK